MYRERERESLNIVCSATSRTKRHRALSTSRNRDRAGRTPCFAQPLEGVRAFFYRVSRHLFSSSVPNTHIYSFFSLFSLSLVSFYCCRSRK